MVSMTRTLVPATAAALLAMISLLPGVSLAETGPGFHFYSICRSDPAAKKNVVTVNLHGLDSKMNDGTWFQMHDPLPGVTVNVLWTYVDYRQNHAVFKYRQDSCTTANDGSCTFHGANGRARWQLSEVVGYEMSSPAFPDTLPTDSCPNSLMIDFW